MKSLHGNKAQQSQKINTLKKKEKNPLAKAGGPRDDISIPRSGRSLGRGNDTPLQSCLEHATGRRIWWAIVRRAAKHWTRLGTHTQHLERACSSKSSVPYLPEAFILRCNFISSLDHVSLVYSYIYVSRRWQSFSLISHWPAVVTWPQIPSREAR